MPVVTVGSGDAVGVAKIVVAKCSRGTLWVLAWRTATLGDTCAASNGSGDERLACGWYTGALINLQDWRRRLRWQPHGRDVELVKDNPGIARCLVRQLDAEDGLAHLLGVADADALNRNRRVEGV